MMAGLFRRALRDAAWFTWKIRWLRSPRLASPTG
jgi:hypothetical protein